MKMFNVLLILILLYFLNVDVYAQGENLQEQWEEYSEYCDSVKTNVFLGTVFSYYFGDVEMNSIIEVVSVEGDTVGKRNVKINMWSGKKENSDNRIKKYSFLGIKVGCTIDLEEIKNYLKEIMNIYFSYFKLK